MNNTVTNVLMVGVGGQGIILASDILAESLMEAGFDVKKSEVHGMAQRGGSVSSHVRFGKKVFSPLIARRQVDILYCMEMLEALRYIDFLKADSLVILNDYRLNPPSVSLGVEQYPEGIYDIFTRYFSRVALIDGVALAQQNRNPRTVGTIILGYLSRYLDIPPDIWESVIRRRVPKKAVDVNLSGFEIGRNTDRIR